MLISCTILVVGCVNYKNNKNETSSLQIVSSDMMNVSGDGTAHSPFTATSTNKTDNSTGEVIFNVTQGGTLNFQITASSEPNFDFGRLYINGSMVASVSGTETTGTQQLVVSEGDTITFTYEKDAFASAGNDEAILDFLLIQ